MAHLWITEYSGSYVAHGRGGTAALQPPIAEQVVPISELSTQSATLHPNTTLVRVHCDSTCSILFGVDPTATWKSSRMPANMVEYFSVPDGTPVKVAVITTASMG